MEKQPVDDEGRWIEREVTWRVLREVALRRAICLAAF